MRKYAINYSRSFPDHRTTHDFKVYEAIRRDYATSFRVPPNLRRFGNPGSMQISPNTTKSMAAHSVSSYLPQ